MTTLTGRLLAVNTIPLGSPLDGDQAAGATSLLVTDPGDFSETGGWLKVGDEVLAYDSVDYSTNEVTLATTTSADHFDDDRVDLYDPDVDQAAVELEAQVAPEGNPGGDPVFAQVLHSLQPLVSGGIGQTNPVVVLEQFGDAWVLTNILGQTAQVDGTYLNSATLPAMAGAFTDPPADTAGYPEGFEYWLVDADGNQLGLWQQTAGAWVPITVVSQPAIAAAAAYIKNLLAEDFTVLNQLIAEGASEFDGPVLLRNILTLATGVTAPTIKPKLSAEVQSLEPATRLPYTRSLTENSATPGSGTAWVTGWDHPDGYLVLAEVDKTAGAVTQHIPGIGCDSVYGIVRLGGYYYVAVTNSGTVQVHKIDATTWGFVSAWSYSGTIPTAFSSDGTNVVFAYARSSDGKPVLRSFNPTSGAQVGSNLVGDTAMPNNYVYSLWAGAADFGALRYVLGSDVSGHTRVFDSTGTRQSGDEWTGQDDPGSFYWDSATSAGRFHQISNGLIYHYGKQTSTITVTATETLTDGASAETAAGVASDSVSWTKRRYLRVELPDYPSDPAGLFGKVYVGTTSTRRLQTTTPAFNAATNVGYIDSLNTGSTVAPTSQSGSFAAGGVGDIAAGPRRTYNPTFGAATTNPNVGTTGSVVGRYRKITGEIDFSIDITFGGTGISGGSGVWQVTLPVPELATHGLVFTGIYRDSAGSVSHVVFGEKINTSQQLNLKTNPDPTGTTASLRNITGTTPKTPAAGDYLRLAGRYEPA